MPRNTEAYNEWARKHRLAHPEMYKQKLLRRKLSGAEARKQDRASARVQVMRELLIERLGGVCIRCGYSDPRALQFDHIHGDGASDRSQVRSRYKKWLADSSLEERIQLLCCNCNWIKALENKEFRRRGH